MEKREIGNREALVRNFLGDLTAATTVDLFDQRVRQIREMGGTLPSNLLELKRDCLARNVSFLQSEISGAKTPWYREKRETELAKVQKELKAVNEALARQKR